MALGAACAFAVVNWERSTAAESLEPAPADLAPQQVALRADDPPAAKSPAGSKPNIVFILADNLGYGEPGCYGGGILRGAPTPRIDRLASEGMRLLNFNVESQCTPSRSALMTGRGPGRTPVSPDGT